MRLVFPSLQSAAPRLMNSVWGLSRSNFGSKAQSCFPVSAPSAISRENGVVTYITPSTTRGVASNALRVGAVLPSLISPVWNVQATFRRLTFERLICLRGEYLAPSGVPEYEGHSCAPRAAKARTADRRKRKLRRAWKLAIFFRSDFTLGSKARHGSCATPELCGELRTA